MLQKGLGHLAAPCLLLLLVTRYELPIHYLLPIISVLAENTLLETACHFLLLLVGFNTLTYRKDYDRSPILWVIGPVSRGMAWQSAQTILQVKWSSICNELHIDETPHDLISSLSFRYSTILNVVSMARGEA